jgi:hypothetical protein
MRNLQMDGQWSPKVKTKLFHGYDVKGIGDGFIVTFRTVA